MSDLLMVTAYVRPDRLTPVKQALADAGAPAFTVSESSGGLCPSGTGSGPSAADRGGLSDLPHRKKIECVIADAPVGAVVEAIEAAAHTGEPGDGVVLVHPVDGAADIPSGTRGPGAV